MNEKSEGKKTTLSPSLFFHPPTLLDLNACAFVPLALVRSISRPSWLLSRKPLAPDRPDSIFPPITEQGSTIQMGGGGLFPGGGGTSGDGRSSSGVKAPSPSPSSSPRPPSPAQDALAGACAGALARVCVGPLDVLKIRFQVQLEPVLGEAAALRAAGSKYRGLGQALRLIVREEGLAGLWRGTVPGLLLTVPYTAVQFVTLQAVKGAAAARKGRGREWAAAEGGGRGAGDGGGGRGTT